MLDEDGLGDRIRFRREELRLSQEELARRAGVTPRYIQYLEQSLRKNPSLRVTLGLMDALDLTIDALSGEGPTAERKMTPKIRERHVEQLVEWFEVKQRAIAEQEMQRLARVTGKLLGWRIAMIAVYGAATVALLEFEANTLLQLQPAGVGDESGRPRWKL